MKNWRVLVLLGILLGILLASCCGFGCNSAKSRPFIRLNDLDPRPQTAPASVIDTPLRIVVSPSLSTRDTVGYYRQIAEHVAIQTGQPTELIYRRNNAEAQALLSSKGADLAFFSTGTFLTYSGEEKIEPLVVPELDNGPFYQALIIVPADSPSNELTDLFGKRFGFSDTASFSGYLYPVYLLKLRQKTPEHFFSHTFLSQSHSKSLQAVAMKLLDGAAIDSIVLDHARRTAPDLANAVKIIHASPPIGTGPVVIRASLTEQKKDLLRIVFLNMHHNQDMRKVLRELMFVRFNEVPLHLYDVPRQTLLEMKALR